jgi:hypothetical protein
MVVFEEEGEVVGVVEEEGEVVGAVEVEDYDQL